MRESSAQRQKNSLSLQTGSRGAVARQPPESTASYWKPLYNILEESDFKAIVVNAQHMKAVPGRKTDVKGAEWIADLVQHGLLKASFIPNKEQRELRKLVAYRKSLVGERTRELNRLQKILEGANIKLSGTVKDIYGMSARNILAFILTGETFAEAKYDEVYANKQHIKNLDDEIDNFMKPDEKDATEYSEDWKHQRSGHRRSHRNRYGSLAGCSAFNFLGGPVSWR